MHVRQFDCDGNAIEAVYGGHQFVRSVSPREGATWWALSEFWPEDAGYDDVFASFPPSPGDWGGIAYRERPVYKPYGYYAGDVLVPLVR